MQKAIALIIMSLFLLQDSHAKNAKTLIMMENVSLRSPLSLQPLPPPAADAVPVHLGRTPLNRCTSTPIVCPSCDPFEAKTLDLPDNATLTVRIGPSGRQRGYMGITGIREEHV